MKIDDFALAWVARCVVDAGLGAYQKASSSTASGVRARDRDRDRDRRREERDDRTRRRSSDETSTRAKQSEGNRVHRQPTAERLSLIHI